MTAKLVKARPKSFDYLREQYGCCDELAQHEAALGEMTVDLAQGKMSRPDVTCKFCGAEHGQFLLVPDVRDGLYVALPSLDLDEGPTA